MEQRKWMTNHGNGQGLLRLTEKKLFQYFTDHQGRKKVRKSKKVI